MRLEFDSTKNARNIRERGISFERVADMDLDAAVAIEDARTDYGERRVRLIGPIDGRLHVAVITYRGDNVRVISLRRASAGGTTVCERIPVVLTQRTPNGPMRISGALGRRRRCFREA